MWYEILLWILGAPLLELIITLIVEKISVKIKWQPLKKEFEENAKNATADKFVMTLNSDNKAVVFFGIGAFVLFLVLGIVLYTVIYVANKMSLTDFIIVNIVYNIVCIVPLFLLLKSYTRTIFFNNKEILVKSLFYFRRLPFDKIDAVKERISTVNSNSDKLIIYSSGKKAVSITKCYLNYDLAKARLGGLFLIENN